MKCLITNQDNVSVISQLSVLASHKTIWESVGETLQNILAAIWEVQFYRVTLAILDISSKKRCL